MNKSIGILFAPTHNAFNVILIGLCGYLIFRSDNRGIIFFSAVFQLSGWLIVQWISCYTGQLLEDSVSELREELYSMNWYDMNHSLRSTFKLFQLQLSLPVHFKIQPFPVLNKYRFSDLIKGVYSFFMFLQGRNY
ncbi:uncharacterized protein LOC123680181 [Harmonia axyridis]|uniref:uncharacterized protein LOC123680181 n=1 Tax=Harmonia axyridis TaxID=115357 RepID=UPI001E279527|nr:uncharacterized protein LOC123680181 [Harmonia axyridis]